jgi:hypothetical protein
MKEDPVVAEVRKAREEHAARFGYDLDAIVQDFKTREGKDQAPVVSLPPKRISPQPS